MKKFFLIAVAACVALASCTKNEVAPSDPQEITYLTAPVVKALGPNQSAFDDANRFRTWAFHDQADWSSASTTAQLYLGGTLGLEIKKVGDVWKNADQAYYWPKTGKLTFYSYSLNKTETFLTAGTVACSNSGITVTGYDVVENLDVDFMVADQAENLTENTTTYLTSGVPTLFRHKLSNVIFKVQTADDYDGKTFTLKSITLNGVAKVANYAQNPGGAEAWGHTSTTNIIFSNTSQEFSKTTVITPTANQSYYIPQVFEDSDDVNVTIVYDITTENGSATPAKETVTETKKLRDIFTSWAIGTKYTCTVTVSLNEILWDPAVEKWTEDDTPAATI